MFPRAGVITARAGGGSGEGGGGSPRAHIAPMRVSPAIVVACLTIAASMTMTWKHTATAQMVVVPDAGGIGYGRHASPFRGR